MTPYHTKTGLFCFCAKKPVTILISKLRRVNCPRSLIVIAPYDIVRD